MDEEEFGPPLKKERDFVKLSEVLVQGVEDLWGEELDETVKNCRNFEDPEPEFVEQPSIVPTGAYGKGLTYDRMVLASKGYIPSEFSWPHTLFMGTEFIQIDNLDHHHVSEVCKAAIKVIGNISAYPRSVVVYAGYLYSVLLFVDRNPEYFRNQGSD